MRESLEQLRPREWCVTWRYKRGPKLSDGWDNDERGWDDFDHAAAHARALRDLGEVTGDIAHVMLSVRVAKLEPGDWSDVDEW